MKHTLYKGDCLEVMNAIQDKSIDLILCDLPYGTTKCKWDVIIPFDKLWEQYNRIIRDNGAIVLFAKEPFTSLLICSNLKMFKYRWNWLKDTKSNFMQANYQPLNNEEDIAVFSNAYAREIKNKTKMIYNPQFTDGKPYKIPKESKTTDMFNENHKNGVYKHYNRDTTKRYPFVTINFNIDKPKLHPTQKPVALLEYLIKTYTNENMVILDNCMGSNSTGIASLNTNRNYIGIEKDDAYFDIGVERARKHIEENNIECELEIIE